MKDCFGFYDGSVICVERCCLVKQCKAFTVSDGLDIIDSVIEIMADSLDDTDIFIPVQSLAATLAQLANPTLAKRVLEGRREGLFVSDAMKIDPEAELIRAGNAIANPPKRADCGAPQDTKRQTDILTIDDL